MTNPFLPQPRDLFIQDVLTPAVRQRVEDFADSILLPGEDSIRPIDVNEAFHDPEKIPAGKVLVAVYPLTTEQSRSASIETLVTIYLAIQASVPASQTNRIKRLLAYVQGLKAEMEINIVNGAVPVKNTDTQFLWLPDFLHADNVFTSLIELHYKFKSFPGGRTL